MRRSLIVCALALAACQHEDVSRALGARCDLSSECDEECLTPSDAWPGGFCSTICDMPLDCESGATCADEQGAGACELLCAQDSDCTFLGLDYGCKSRDGHGTNGGQSVMVCRGA
jgi:hypothetical protein